MINKHLLLGVLSVSFGFIYAAEQRVVLPLGGCNASFSQMMKDLGCKNMSELLRHPRYTEALRDF